MKSTPTFLSPRSKLRLIVLLGLLAPVWWTWIAGRLTYGIYAANGSPSRPSLGLLLSSVYAPALVLGVLTGIAVTLLSKESPLKGWIIFCASLVVGAAFESVLTNAGLWDCLIALFGSYENLVFWIGSLIWPISAHVRGRAARPAM
jgi:hypothetical protein